MDEKNEIEELAPWMVIVFTLIGAGLRVFFITSKGLWLDETFSIWLSSHKVGEMLQWIVRIDHNPPLYYLLLHYWMSLRGDSAYSVRLLSALLGAGAIPVIYQIGKRMAGWGVGLAAAILLAVSPFNIRFAQEARMYTLLVFNASMAIYALVRLLTDPRSAAPIGSQFREYLHAWRTSRQPEPDTAQYFSYGDEARKRTGWRAWIYRHRWLPIQAVETDLAWVAFIIFSAATMLTHNTAVLFPIAANVFVLGLMIFQRMSKSGSPPSFQAPSFWNWIKAQAAIFLLWSPWIFAFINQAGRVEQEYWILRPTWDSLVQALRTLLNETVLAQSSLVRIIWVLYALALCLGLVFYAKKLSRFLFIAALLVIPFSGELLVSIRRPVFLDRTLIWTAIPLILLLAAGIAQFRFRILIVVALGIFSANNLFSTGDYYRFAQKEDWSGPAGFVANFIRNGDLIIFNATSAQIPFDYYFKVYEDQYSIRVEKHGAPADLFDSGVLEPKMTQSDIPRLVSLLNGHTRVFLVYSHNWNTDPERLIQQTIASKMKLIVVREYSGVQVQWYEAP